MKPKLALKSILGIVLLLSAALGARADCFSVNCYPDLQVLCGTAWSFQKPEVANCEDCGVANGYGIIVTSTTNFYTTEVLESGEAPLCVEVFIQSWLITNQCHDSFTCTQYVNVFNTNQPVFAGISNLRLSSSSCSNVPAYYNVTASQPCCGSLNVVCTPPSGSLFAPGTTLVQCVA